MEQKIILYFSPTEHDGQEQNFNNGQFVPLPQPTVHNRARQESGQRSLQGNPSQNRGQDFEQHPSAATRTRTPELVVEQPFEEAQPPRRPEPEPASFNRFQPQQANPEPFQPAPQQNRPQQGQAPASFQAFQPGLNPRHLNKHLHFRLLKPTLPLNRASPKKLGLREDQQHSL